MTSARLSIVLGTLVLFSCSEQKVPSNKIDQMPVSGSSASLAESGAEVLAPGEQSAAEIERLAKEREALARKRVDDRKQKFTKDTASSLWAKATIEARAQNHRDAADLYTAFAVHHPEDPRWALALQHAMRGRFAVSDFAEGLNLVEDALYFAPSPVAKARVLRVLGNTYLAIPHWGTTRGGEYLRAQYTQGESTQSYVEDRARAIECLEQARTLMATYAEAPPKGVDAGVQQPPPAPKTPRPATQEITAENTELSPLSAKEYADTQFELVGAIARFTPYDSQWNYWWYAWAAGQSDGREDDEGEDERVGRGRRGQDWSRVLYSAKPKGLPVTEGGEIVFAPIPKTYSPSEDDSAKIKFLLEELRTNSALQVDDAAARSLLMQGLLFQARDGMHRLDRLRNYWFGGTYAYKSDLEKMDFASLGEDEVIGLVATHVAKFRVPPEESLPRLVRRLVKEYPESPVVSEGRYYLGQYFQSRLQFDAARETYAALTEGSSPYASAARAAIASMDHHEAAVRWSGVQPAGVSAKVNLRFRNLKNVELKFRPVDQERILADFKKAYANGGKFRYDDVLEPTSLGYRLVDRDNKAVSKYAAKVTHSVKHAVTPDAAGHYVDVELDSGIRKPGLYVVDVFEPERSERLGRGLINIERIALVQKRDTKGQFDWIVDAVTGSPLSKAKVERFHYWTQWKDRYTYAYSSQSKSLTDNEGIARADQTNHQTLTTVRANGAVTYVGWSYYYGSYSPNRGSDEERVALVMTDRPVYRPGDEVKFKVWARKKSGGIYQDASKLGAVSVVVRGPKSETLETKSLTLGEFGDGSFNLPLGDDAPLGRYSVYVTIQGYGARAGDASFRVEEYKAPEFTVAVKAAGQARLGEKVQAEVQADYLFGGGVAGGTVTYRVYRQDHSQEFHAPGRWDWLYGAGYGHAYYAYDWFDWWDGMGPRPWVWYPWWGPPAEPARELVLEGEGKLDDKGRFKIEIDTQTAKMQRGESDHRYTVAAEVVDLSRRLIKGEGSIVVTRNAFFASIENEAGYFRINEDVKIAVVTHKPDGTPLAVKGKVVVDEIRFQGTDNDNVKYQGVETFPIETDVHGATRLTFRPKRTGQYRLTFVAKDAWGGEVRKSTVAWVVGPEWHGKKYRFNGLELLADKRVYEKGDVAKLLVNTNRSGASVLLATRVDQGTLVDYKIIQMNGKSMIVEVPIDASRVPNFFIEATTVSDGRLYQDVRELFVPPEDVELNVEVTANKETYGPGDEVILKVKTSTPAGAAVAADVALSVFDTSVLYIQPETTPDPRKHFWATKRTHHVQSASSLTRVLSWSDNLSPPDRQAYWTLYGASQKYFQNEINWRYTDSMSQLKGASALASFSAKDQESKSPEESRDRQMNDEDDSAFGLGSRGSGAGGGGTMAKRKSAKAERAEPAELAAEKESADAAPAPEAPSASSVGGLVADKKNEKGAAPKKAAKVRRSFADTAHFAPTVRTDKDGNATVRFKLPDNLTTWRVKAIGFAGETRTGQSASTLLTTKKLLVRLQAPRFFRERDKVALSAVVHNGFETSQNVEVSIAVDDKHLKLTSPQMVKITVAPGADQRVDFWATAIAEGSVSVRMDAVSKDESDAKELTFPVLVHGMTKTVSSVGSMAVDGPSEKSLEIEIPEDRREALSRLEVRVSPSLAGGMMDALPYLLEYPYGCTEQTLSRFVPAVLTRKALQQAGGLKLEALADPTRKNLNPQQLTQDGKPDATRVQQDLGLQHRSAVFQTKELNAMIASGLTRLAKMQNPDGGWGWWGQDGSSRYTTAHVVAGLLDAQDADLAFDQSMLQRGQRALTQMVANDLWRYDRHKWVGNDDAYAAWVMSRYKEKNDKLLEYLWSRRATLSGSGKIFAALTFHAFNDASKAETLLKNAEQLLERDDENETSWLETDRNGWWYWYHDVIETNALYLRALDTMRPKSADAPRVVKWLLNHRKNGYYWSSTRDTAAVIAAFANHMQKSGERSPDYDLEILLDGEVKKTIHIDKTNMFTFDNVFVLEGEALKTGKHRVTFRRKGKGAVYFNSYLSYFTTEEDVTGTGLEIKVNRTYFKLVRDDRVRKVQGDRGQPLEMKEVAYRKVPLVNGATLASGDLVLVELMLESKNDYTFLAFEDPKPAGMEPVALRSGTTYGEAVANMELRDEKVVFFLRELTRGKLKLSYRLRAEIPGEFHAMPTFGFGMYAPELKTNSDEMRFKIVDN